jgi:hypothetical protein
MRRLSILWVIVMLCAGCSGPLSGEPAPAPTPEFSSADAFALSTMNLKGAGAIRYRGTLIAPAGDKVTLDITTTKAGESTGELTVNGLPSALVVVERTLYLKAGVEFWRKLSGVPDTTAPIVADRWVKAPGALLGVDVERIFDSETLPVLFGKTADAGQALTTAKRVTIAGIEVLEIETGSGQIYLSANQPHGIVRFDLTKAGRTDPTKAHSLAFGVTDATGNLPGLYRTLAARAAELDGAYDPFSGVRQGIYRFENCGRTSCAIVVDLTNIGKTAVRVAVKATFTGDGKVLGWCESRVGPLQPGTAGTATCTLASPEWGQFFRRAQSVPGQHPYSAEWTAMALTTPPNPAPLTAMAASAETPVANPQGNQHVYLLRDASGTTDRQIWKYAVASGPEWRRAADPQLRYCLVSTRAQCSVDELVTTGDPASAHALARQFVDAYRGRTGTCPPAQWVGCPR